jgi:hypothetical protein
MQLQSLRIGAAFGLMLRTMPILLVRLGVYLAFWVVALVYLAIVFGLAALLGNIHGLLSLIVILVGLGATIPLYHMAYRYVFYMIKAAHIAVLSELIANGSLPAGQGQLAWGKQRVRERFGEVNVMFVVDELVNSVVRMFTGTVYRLAAWLPGDFFRTLASIVNRVVRYATTYIDEAILARSFLQPNRNPWDSAREGLVLYGMAWRPLLTNAIVLMLLSYVPFILAVVVFAAPVGGLLYLISPRLAAWSVLVVLVLAYLIKAAVGDAFAMAAIIASYQRETANLIPDPEVEARLEQVSVKFGELKRRALDAVRPAAVVQPAPPLATERLP